MKMRFPASRKTSEKRLGRPRLPLLTLCVACGVLVGALCRPNELAAGTSSFLGPDYDQDGLADSQEWVLGTLPDQVDSDGDGFHDLEELARESDPLDPAAIPVAQPLSVGMFSYEENDRLNMHTAIYVDDGQLANLVFELGVVWNGVPVTVARSLYSSATRGFFYGSPQDPKDKILVLVMPIPDSVILSLGNLSTYSKVERLGSTEKAVAVTNFTVEPSTGTIARIEMAPASIQGGKGVVYRPLTTGSAPATSTAGKICWQKTAVVGTKGTSLVYEVEQASCEDFDTYCTPQDCANAVGGTIELPDPGGLLGG